MIMQPDYLFETSWEVCNKVGGIHTVVSTKAKTLVEKFRDNYIVIGPDVWKDTKSNPEFEEDSYILKTWRSYAESKGLRIRIGRWKIQGEPIAILVDFTTFFNEKDKLFTEFWNDYKLDSLTGQWDYIEPFLFGYAAAKVVESYYEFYLSSQDKIIAQFHEWMTGSGVLYLKKAAPQISTIFTTHATVLGRCIAGNNLPLYSELDTYNPQAISNEFNVRSKYSLENLSAHHADVFTTVSEITNSECRHFFEKPVDIVTPNGFEPTFVPNADEFDNKRLTARERVFDLVEALMCQKMDRDSILIINSGRYEYKNKGIDIFIQAMGELNRRDIDKNIVAVIAVPAHHVDVYKSMITKMGKVDFSNPTPNQYLTHHLFDPEHDPILRAIRENGLNNSSDDKVKIVFIPSYLNGNDGVVNLHYFDFLIGFDISVFPSYYEPWGYTPMESMAFHIPSITTTLAGFGLWIQDKVQFVKGALGVIERNDTDSINCVKDIADKIEQTLDLSQDELELLRDKAYQISKTTLWQNLIEYYYKAFDLALKKSESRYSTYSLKQPIVQKYLSCSSWGEKPSWKKILFKPLLPQRIEGLQRLSQNLWWSWNLDAYNLFYYINKERFLALDKSPIRLIESLTNYELDALINNKQFIENYDRVMSEFDSYMSKAELNKDKDMIAYFSMEFGIHDTLKIFSGGLGMLAGDYLKEASDCNKNIIGIGLLYRYGYFKQKITKSGEQVSVMTPQKFTHLPIKAVRDEEGKWKKVSVVLPGRTVWAKIWRCDVGRVPLYLLDTDIDENQEHDREITYQLYGGDWENRLKQEMILGIGGVRMIEELGFNPTIFHSNEGHSAFNSLERMSNLIYNQNMSYVQAKEIVKSSTLFTTHTPVPAGHDAFSEDLMRVYMSHFADRLGLSWDDFIALGRMHRNNTSEKFSMSVLALNFSQEVNGVSAIHARVSREMFVDMYPGYFSRELHIGHVTNGVHQPTWVDKSFSKLYDEVFTTAYREDQSNGKYWQRILEVDDEKVWSTHLQAKERLVNFLRERLDMDLKARAEDPRLFLKTIENFNSNTLTFGFARRFATYKRAHLLFTNMERLEKIVNNVDMPVQFVFAGKAHPADKAGQDLIKHIIEVSKIPAFIGKIIFIENYDMFVAKHLIRGVDVWLNTPTRPLEASGTSGEKAVMNGVVNFSVLDGWWAEGWQEGAGWMLPEEQEYDSDEYQNAFDAEMIYDIIENEIVPTYYNKDERGVSKDWVSHIKNTIAYIAPRFTMKRQLDDYYDKFYNKLIERSHYMKEDNGLKAREYAAWKHRMRRHWNSLELLEAQFPDVDNVNRTVEDSFKLSITLLINDINPEYIGAEVVVARKENNEIHDYYKILPMEMENFNNGRVTFSLDTMPTVAGVYDYSIRVYPKHPMMPHRMDFPIIKWI